jgi:protease-4
LIAVGVFTFASAVYQLSSVGTRNNLPVEHTAVVRVEGVLASNLTANADNLIESLQKAFESESSKGVVLQINSPGGSPVIAGQIYDAITELKAEYPEKTVYAVIDDIGASGGYYIAAAADYIYADRASIVGSIGVISAGFDFTDLMDKLGVERRMYIAGQHKALLDPFVPMSEETVNLWQSVLDNTHEQFIARVREGRKGRLKESEITFSGMVWTGEQAVEFGLIDGLGSTRMVARDLIKAETIKDYTPNLDFIRLLSQRIQTQFQEAIMTSRLTL